MRNRQTKRATGFTLVETLLAIAILSLAVIGPLSIAANGLAAGTIGKDRLVAVALARDAIEYVRNRRDNNILAGQPWLEGIALPGDPCYGGFCLVDSVNGTIVSKGTSSGVLQYDDPVTHPSDPNRGLYAYGMSGWSPSEFSRWVAITTYQSYPDDIEVTATVQWRTIFTTKTVVLTEELTNHG